MDPYAAIFAHAAPTPQTAPIPGREAEMVTTPSGGVLFAVDDWQALRRFLIIGTTGGTFYCDERKATAEGAEVVERCLKADGPRAVAIILEVLKRRLAPRPNPAILALAMACSARFADEPTRLAALAAVPHALSIGYQLFMFCRYARNLRRYGRGLRRAISAWYMGLPVERLAYQALKYQSRDGWSHRDVLRLAHVGSADSGQRIAGMPDEADRRALLTWITHGTLPEGDAFAQIRASAALRGPEPVDAPALIRAHRLTREMVPTELLGQRSTWEALLDDMPYVALVRNLGVLGARGILALGDPGVARVIARLTDAEAVRRSGLHPYAIMLAAAVYAQGHGEKGSLRWTPIPSVLDALTTSFHAAFETVEPCRKRILVAVDDSGSMQSPTQGGPISAAQAAAAMALVTAKREPSYLACAFSIGAHWIELRGASSLGDVARLVGWNPQNTDCTAPLALALQHRAAVDAFVLYTDSQSWAGGEHVTQALARYRREMGIQARLVVVQVTGDRGTICDPKDPLQLEVVGFDASGPALVSAFLRGDM